MMLRDTEPTNYRQGWLDGRNMVLVWADRNIVNTPDGEFVRLEDLGTYILSHTETK